MSKNFKYMARALQDCKIQKGEEKGKPDIASMLLIAWAALDHHFDEHTKCGDWCRRKHETVAQQLESKKIYRSKTNAQDKLLYEKLREIFEKYNAVDKLMELCHGMHTNHCKWFNNACTWCAPKIVSTVVLVRWKPVSFLQWA